MSEDQIGVAILWDDAHFRRGMLYYTNSMEKAVRETRDAVVKMSTEGMKMQKNAATNAKKAGDATASYSKRLGGIARQVRSLVPILGLVGLSRAVTRTVSSSLEEFRKFQYGMQEVFTLIPDLSAQAQAQMSMDIQMLGREMARITDETVPALYQAISAGVPPDNVMEFMTIASQAARGGVATLKDSVDVLSSVVNAYGYDVISVQEASDALFSAVQGGKLTFTELARSAFNVVPVAAALNVKFQDITAALAAMTKQGVPARTATTQLRQVLVNLSQDGREAADVFRNATGQSFAQFIQSGNTMHDAMVVLDQAAKDMNVTTADLFGNIRAGQGSLVLTGRGLEIYANEMERVAGNTGITQRAAERMTQTVEYQRQEFKANAEALKIGLGYALKDVTVDFYEAANSALEFYLVLTDFKQMFDGVVSGLQETNITQEAMIKTSSQLIENYAGMDFFDQMVGDISGFRTETKKAIEEFSNSIIAQSDTVSEAQKLLSEMAGEYLEIDQNTGAVELKVRGLGVVFNYTNDEMEALVGTQERVTVAQQDAVIAATQQEKAFGELDEPIQQLLGTLDELAQKHARFVVQMLSSSDVQSKFNKMILDIGTSAGFSVDQIIELARKTGAYSDVQLKAAGILGEAREDIDYMILSMSDLGYSYEDIIELVMEKYGADIAEAQALIDSAEATDTLISSQEKAVQIQERLLELQEQRVENMSKFFDEMVKTSDEAGIFTEALDDIGQQYVVVNGRTTDQNRILQDLQDEYKKTEEKILGLQYGTEGLGLSSGELNDKLAEQRERLLQIEERMTPLLDVTGKVVEVNNTAKFNQEALNELLYEAAVSAGADAHALALLAVATGQLSEEQATAALKAAAMQSKIVELGEAIEEGLSIDEAISELDTFRERLETRFVVNFDTDQIDKGNQLIDTVHTKIIDEPFPSSELMIDSNLADVERNLRGIQEMWPGISSDLADEAGEADAEIGTAMSGIEAGVARAIGVYQTEFSNATKATETEMGAMVSTIKEDMDVIEVEVGTTATDLVIRWQQWAVDMQTETKNAMSGMNSEMVTYIPIMQSTGRLLSEGVATGILSGKSAVVNAAAGMIAQAILAAQQEAGIQSPSTVMIGMAMDFVLGFLIGVQKMHRPAQETVADLINMLAQEYEVGLQDLLDIFAEYNVASITDINSDIIDALVETFGLGEEAAEDFRASIESIVDEYNKFYDAFARVLQIAQDFASAGGFFGNLFEEQVLDPLQDQISATDDQIESLIDELQNTFDLDDEEILAQLPELLAYANRRGLGDVADSINEIIGLQQERNSLEEEYRLENERILELQRQQQQLDFLQRQFELLRTIEEAGLDPSEILGGITLGIDASIPDLIDAMNAALTAMIAQVDSQLQIQSPSKVFIEKGFNVGAGMAIGVEEGLRYIGDAFMGLDNIQMALPSGISSYAQYPVNQTTTNKTVIVQMDNKFIGDKMDAELFKQDIRKIIAEEF